MLRINKEIIKENLNDVITQVTENLNNITTQITELNNKLGNKVEQLYLAQNPDINKLRSTSGVYGLYQCSQAPTTSIAVLEVLVYTGDWVLQRITDIGNGCMWERRYVEGTHWTGWVQRW